MKKKIIAIAVLNMLTGFAYAQSNVTIYGVVDVGVAYEDKGGSSKSAFRVDSNNLNGSRLGFKGSEDLGNGVSAIFTFENGFNPDTGTAGQGGLLFGRQSWLGVQGSFGTVKAGRQGTPVYDNAGTFDPFGDALAGDSARFFNYSGNRTNNALSYGYQANGFRTQLQYGFGEVAGNNTANQTIGGAVGYANGPLDLVVTYTGNENATGDVNGKTTLIGGNYNFGPVQVYASYAWNKNVVAPAGTVQAGADSRDALVGLAVPVGANGRFVASYIKATDRAVSDSNADQVAIGFIHDLSKRTALYTSFSHTSNDKLASYNSGTAGANDSLFNLGVRHKF